LNILFTLFFSYGPTSAMPYTCATCGQTFDALPMCFGVEAPWRQMGVKDDEFSHRVFVDSDLCIIDGEHFFIRGHIEIPVIGRDELFVYSVWCSLSKSSFEHVTERWNDPERAGDSYFGWLCSLLPGYPTPTTHLPAKVESREVGVVPRVLLHETDHPLYREQRDGIDVPRLEQIVHDAMHTAGPHGSP
jgi:hypothetical protein